MFLAKWNYRLVARGSNCLSVYTILFNIYQQLLCTPHTMYTLWMTYAICHSKRCRTWTLTMLYAVIWNGKRLWSNWFEDNWPPLMIMMDCVFMIVTLLSKLSIEIFSIFRNPPKHWETWNNLELRVKCITCRWLFSRFIEIGKHEPQSQSISDHLWIFYINLFHGNPKKKLFSVEMTGSMCPNFTSRMHFEIHVQKSTLVHVPSNFGRRSGNFVIR